jgi:hypothetical protein
VWEYIIGLESSVNPQRLMRFREEVTTTRSICDAIGDFEKPGNNDKGAPQLKIDRRFRKKPKTPAYHFSHSFASGLSLRDAM